jgi:hypothetical protein
MLTPRTHRRHVRHPAGVIAREGPASYSTASGTAPEGELGPLAAALRAADRAMAAAVEAAVRLDGRRVVAEEGMTVELACQLHTGATRTDVHTLLTAADVLEAMPITRGLFQRGVLSWGHLRALTTGARSMPAEARAELDGYLGVHAERLERMDPAQRLDAIDDALRQHQPLAKLERQEDRAVDADRAVLLPRLDGTGQLLADLAAESFTTVATALEAEAALPQADPPPGDRPDGLPRLLRHAPSTRTAQLGDALVRLATRALGGGADTGTGVATRFTVTVDLDRLTDQLAGLLEPALATRPPRIVRRALDRLACDSALDLVITNAHRPLAAKRYAPDIPAATRRAVLHRDGGCRFPGCRAPAAWAEIHHVHERARGGDHHPDGLIPLCRRHHQIIHRRGWRQHLLDDGGYRLTRRGRGWTTYPRHHHQLPPPTAVSERPHDPARAGPTEHPTSTRAPFHGSQPDDANAPPADPATPTMSPDLPF